MGRFAEGLAAVALTAWIGGMWIVGYLVVPTLFASLDDRQLAGNLAGKIFAVTGWFSLACGAYLLVFQLVRQCFGALRHPAFWLALVILLLTAASQFGIQPFLAQLKAEAWPREVMESVMRDRFSAWHGVSSALYLVQSGLGLWLVVAARLRP